VQLADLMDLPLVLPTQAGGLRQILDAAALEAHLKLVPLLEVNSLPVVLAMIREQPLCTVLPVSSVQNQINSGALRSHPIVNPTLAQQFYAFHAGLRDLNEPEREFLKLLRSEFTRADNTFDIVTPAVAHG
jgi:DNA-binding transcriptional LysR family regulator